MRRYLCSLWLLCIAEALCFAQPQSLKTILATFFQRYEFGFNGKAEPCKIEDVKADDKQRELHIYVSESFAMQSFSQEKVETLYKDLANVLPENYRNHRLFVYGKGKLIEELVIGGAKDSPLQRTWGSVRYRGNAWVTPQDRAYSTANGLEGHHFSVWASHGRFYSQTERVWRWQRPRLYCTTEDLLSQTFVIPYLIPMLENAGAIVYSPRERDWQKHEMIVDNDTPGKDGIYVETEGSNKWETAGTGFAHLKDIYLDGENPFAHGTVRMAATQSKKTQASYVEWTPTIPADGRYAVYVSYQTLPTSISDATYTVVHRGQQTRFSVNQQMGGSTWVYLGTFDFAAGNSAENCVILSNHSSSKGHVTADAVRFGGGMGNIARGDSLNLSVSGLPRFLEGARYSAQWAGMPYWVYGNKNGENDYAEDINVRSYSTNHLAGGSIFFPADSGLNVPIELSLALHTDAGYTKDNNHIGSLAIYTTDFLDGLFPAGLSRLTARDLCDIILTQVDNDMHATYGNWTRRQMFDRNYSESREPRMPGIILEMLSHQNFADMRMAHDPQFKFTMARAIYKGILQFIHRVNKEKKMTVQPLPVTAPAAFVIPYTRHIDLSWQAVEDPLEKSATPTGYVVYHAEGTGGFDNGTFVHHTHYELDNVTPDILHRFYITAVNAGGQSMPSQEVCAYVSIRGDQRILIVDGFDRLAGPIPFDNDTIQGFDLLADPGIPMAKMPGYCGKQLYFNKDGYGHEGSQGLGNSGAELEGMIIAGNTFDWSSRHAKDIIQATGGLVTISSCTAAAVERSDFDSRTMNLMDIIFGLEKFDGYSLRMAKVFQPSLVQAIADFVRQGGSMLVSGAYVGTDMTSENDRLLTRALLKYEYAGAIPSDSVLCIKGMNTSFDIYRQMNEQSYLVPSVDCLAPIGSAFCPMVYAPSGQSAAVAYQGTDYRTFTMGFPFESIQQDDVRVALLQGILQFLIPQ